MTQTSPQSGQPHARRFGVVRLVSAALLSMGAVAGSLVFAVSGPASAAGPDTLAGDAFGAQITGLLPLPPTPSIAWPPDGTASSVPVNVPAVATINALNAGVTGTNPTLASEEMNATASVATASVLSQLDIGAVTSTCKSNALGSTGTDTIVGLGIGGSAIPVPSAPNSFIPGSQLGPLSGIISIEVNVQTVTDVKTGAPANHSTDIVNNAIVISVLSGPTAGVNITLAHTHCHAAGPDIFAVPTVTGVNPGSGPAAGGTTVTITGTGFLCVTGVKFGNTPAAVFTVVNPTTITATSPPGVGVVDVTVTNCNGTSPTGAGDKFTYVAAAGNTTPAAPPAAGPSNLTGSVKVTG